MTATKQKGPPKFTDSAHDEFYDHMQLPTQECNGSGVGITIPGSD